MGKFNIYKNENFDKNLNELKSITAQINQIIWLYDALGKDIEDNLFDDVKQKIEEEKNATNEEDVDIFEQKEESDDDESRDDEWKDL